MLNQKLFHCVFCLKTIVCNSISCRILITPRDIFKVSQMPITRLQNKPIQRAQSDMFVADARREVSLKKTNCFCFEQLYIQVFIFCQRALWNKKALSVLFVADDDAVRTAGKLLSNFALANYTGSPGGA